MAIRIKAALEKTPWQFNIKLSPLTDMRGLKKRVVQSLERIVHFSRAGYAFYL